jgi:hypothetical protein
LPADNHSRKVAWFFSASWVEKKPELQDLLAALTVLTVFQPPLLALGKYVEELESDILI